MPTGKKLEKIHEERQLPCQHRQSPLTLKRVGMIFNLHFLIVFNNDATVMGID